MGFANIAKYSIFFGKISGKFSKTYFSGNFTSLVHPNDDQTCKDGAGLIINLCYVTVLSKPMNCIASSEGYNFFVFVYCLVLCKCADFSHFFRSRCHKLYASNSSPYLESNMRVVCVFQIYVLRSLPV